MKVNKMHVLLVLAVLFACLMLSGCTGLIKPSIGESAVAEAAAGEAPAVAEQTGDASGEASGETVEIDDDLAELLAMFSAEPQVEPRPDMAGNLVYYFAMTDSISNGLGATNDLVATVELFDAENPDGKNGLIYIALGSNNTYTPCVWTEEDGVFSLQVDEFTMYESRDVDGVPAIVGVRYSFGMSGSGVVDIPMADVETASSEEPAMTAASDEASQG